MYYHVAATHYNKIRLTQDVSGEQELEAVMEQIQEMATENDETLLITITPRVHLMTAYPKKPEHSADVAKQRLLKDV